MAWVVAVSMHLLVLSAFRPDSSASRSGSVSSQCTFWCSVLSDRKITTRCGVLFSLNAPSGAQCFPTLFGRRSRKPSSGLNAPSGAQCFPTANVGRRRVSRPCLNAPSGAQCFPTYDEKHRFRAYLVSMHLLVLSAFRQERGRGVASVPVGLNAPSGAQCFPTHAGRPTASG